MGIGISCFSHMSWDCNGNPPTEQSTALEFQPRDTKTETALADPTDPEQALDPSHDVSLSPQDLDQTEDSPPSDTRSPAVLSDAASDNSSDGTGTPKKGMSPQGHSSPHLMLSFRPAPPAVEKPEDEEFTIASPKSQASLISFVEDDSVVPLQYRRELDDLTELSTTTIQSYKVHSYESREKSKPGTNNALLQFPTGTTYEGSMCGDTISGVGRMRWLDDTFYIGQWENNQPHGYGKFVLTNGDSYIGQWNDGATHGIGTFYIASTSVEENDAENQPNYAFYRGQWANDRRQGLGVEFLEDGSEHYGMFENGMKHGVGMYRWADGSTIYGEWKADKICGVGHFRGIGGDEYKGNFDDSKMHGIGLYEDNRQYHGEYRHGVRHGLGILCFEGGERFITIWNEGKQEGEGMFIESNGDKKLENSLGLL